MRCGDEGRSGGRSRRELASQGDASIWFFRGSGSAGADTPVMVARSHFLIGESGGRSRCPQTVMRLGLCDLRVLELPPRIVLALRGIRGLEAFWQAVTLVGLSAIRVLELFARTVSRQEQRASFQGRTCSVSAGTGCSNRVADSCCVPASDALQPPVVALRSVSAGTSCSNRERNPVPCLRRRAAAGSSFDQSPRGLKVRGKNTGCRRSLSR